MIILRTIFYFGPLIFAFGFMGPLFAELITQTGWLPPFDASPTMMGMIVAGALGVTAQLRGRWI